MIQDNEFWFFLQLLSTSVVSYFYFWNQLEFVELGRSEIQSSLVYMDKQYAINRKLESWRILCSPRI